MPYMHYDINAAHLTGPGPYAARSANDNEQVWPFWFVSGPDGRNVLTFPGCGGAVFTTRQCAEEIAARWNAKR
jgi:hypothetical protein